MTVAVMTMMTVIVIVSGKVGCTTLLFTFFICYYYFVFSGNDWDHSRGVYFLRRLHHHHGCHHLRLRQVSTTTT